MVDAVITWVDGSDPEHQMKRARYESALQGHHIEPAAGRETRFSSLDEVRYCILLIRKNAPWLEKIFLVTDSQIPKWLTSEERERLNVSIIDHSAIFKGLEHALPTFSSRSIESVLHRIPGLSPLFIYFNDDVFLIRPVLLSDFFEDGVPLLRGSSIIRHKWLRALVWKIFGLPSIPLGLIGVRLPRTAKLPWFIFRTTMLAHAPQPVVRDDLKKIMESRGRLTRNIQFRFRSWMQFQPVGLYVNLGAFFGKVKVVAPHGLYIAPATEKNTGTVLEQARSDLMTLSYLCIQSLDEFSVDARSQVLEFLEEQIS